MSIEPGSRIGPYEVTSHLGEGAMGVVFRAHDTKLQRDVALKLLPENFAKEPERLTRFQREAQLLASLNHPNIAHIYGLEEVDGSGCIVMELVEGETISERLKRTGPFPVDEAIAVSKQIAEALAAAHERGIVHRDLKPANIKLTPNGIVKVLDFGLAKALGAKSQDINVSSLPTLASGSIAGSIVGTIGYMSPEQARGREVDARTDIWAFGCVLYEMLTAHLAFEGETSTDVMARIVTGQPDLNLLPKETPPSIRLLLAATLNKNPQQRLQHIGDMRLFLDDTYFPSTAAGSDVRKASSSWGKLLLAVLALILIIGMIPAVLVLRRAPADLPSMRFEMSLPGLYGIPVPAPDGRRIAFVDQSAEGQRTLWVRGIGDEAAQQLRGTENVNGMLWSPDSRYLAFAGDGKLKKIDASGGSSPQTLFDVTGGTQGVTWNRDGVMLWARNSDHVLVRVSDAGGEIKAVTSLDPSRKETVHALPVFLSDGNHFLYVALSSVSENSGIFVSSLDGKTTPKRIMATPLVRVGGLVYHQGYLLYLSDGKLTAQRFDESALKLDGEPALIAEGLEGSFSASDTGLLMYRKAAADAAYKQLTWFDRTGRQIGEVGTAANYGGIELSPNGDRIAVDIISGGNRDIWIMELARGIPTRVTFDPASDWSAKWSPDGSHIVFASGGRPSLPTQIYQKTSTGVGNDEVIPGDGQPAIPVDWSSDGKYIVFSRTKSNGGNDTWLQPMFGDRKPKPFLESQFDKVLAQVSPDGRWVAYTTNESGSFQIFVQSFPDPTGGKWQISAEGGVEPKWRRDGRELYYIAFDGKLMAVPVKSDRSFEAGKPMALFPTGLAVNRTRPDRDRRYDVTRDGRFLFVMPGKGMAPPITVLVNWPSALK